MSVEKFLIMNTLTGPLTIGGIGHYTSSRLFTLEEIKHIHNSRKCHGCHHERMFHAPTGECLIQGCKCKETNNEIMGKKSKSSENDE